MKNAISVTSFAIAISSCVVAAFAADATLHGQELHRQGTAIHMKNFDVTLDGRLLTASEGIYHPDTGIIDLTGQVRLHFGQNVRTFPGEVK